MYAQKITQCLLAVIGLTCSAFSVATTVLGMDIDKLVNDAELVFEGDVLLHEVRQDQNSGIINTYVTFSISDLIKGDHSADTLELKFAGGTLNGQIMEVSGLTIPKEGEQGIYFVESTNRDLLNPLLGWSQGHILIKEEEGVRRVSTIDNKPITNIQPVSSIPPAIKKPQPLLEGKSDVATGILVDSSAITIERALTVEEFKSRILDLIEN